MEDSHSVSEIVERVLLVVVGVEGLQEGKEVLPGELELVEQIELLEKSKNK
jgi:hypothetical protein